MHLEKDVLDILEKMKNKEVGNISIEKEFEENGKKNEFS